MLNGSVFENHRAKSSAWQNPLFPKLLRIWYISSQKLIISRNSLYENLLHCPYHKITIFLLCAVELCLYLKYSYILTACLLHVPRGNYTGGGTTGGLGGGGEVSTVARKLMSLQRDLRKSVLLTRKKICFGKKVYSEVRHRKLC